MAHTTDYEVVDKSRRRVLAAVSTAAALGFQSAISASAEVAPSTASSPTALMGPRPEKNVRICVVGGGFGRAFYWSEHPDCEVTAVSELRDDRRKLLMEKYRCDISYGDFHEMLGDSNVDAVAMFTPAPQHVRDCVDVLNAGKHVVCAVPAAFTLEECQELIDTVKRTGLTYMQAETGCYHASTMTAHGLAREGKFGTIYYTQAEYLHDMGDFHPGGTPSGLFYYQGKHTWRYGYPPAKYPTHATGPVIYVTADPMAEVAALGWSPKNDPFADNPYHNRFHDVTILAKTKNGNSSRIAIHHCFGGRDDIAERAEYWGTDMVFLEERFGTPAMMSREGEALKVAPPNDHTDKLPPNLRQYVKVGHGGAEVFITHEFVTALIEGRRPKTDVYQGVAYCAPGICAFDSANKGGEWVKVPDFGWQS